MKKIVLIVLLLISLIISGCGKPGTVGVNTTIPNETYVSPSSGVVGTYVSMDEDGTYWLLGIYEDGDCLTKEADSDFAFVGEWAKDGENQLIIHWIYAVYDDGSGSLTPIYDERVRSMENCNLRIEGDKLVGDSGVWVKYEE